MAYEEVSMSTYEVTLNYLPEQGVLQVVDYFEMVVWTLDEDMEQVDFSTMSNEERLQYLYDNYPQDMAAMTIIEN